MTRSNIRRIGPIRIPVRFTKVSWRDLAATLGPILLIGLATIWAALWFVHPAPPNTITITGGPEGSVFQTTAEKYRKILARDGVTLKILPSQGSLENLKRLNDPAFHVDLGFVQDGVSAEIPTDDLVSLGSIFYEPLLVFYSGPVPVDRLSALAGKRLAIGPEGSGTRSLASALLKANGIEAGGTTTLVDLDAEAAAQALLDGKVDAVFLMGDSAAPPIMRKLLRTSGIQLLDFSRPMRTYVDTNT